ncbi:MAG: DUF222 domain-containing protein [Actinobacteria bacterium]|nr:DUF222 domain-containing protein [Actinomycetota bacterium]
MCQGQRPAVPGRPVPDGGEPGSVAGALDTLDRALAVLAGADPASLPAETQARVLRALERAEARQTAARGAFLAAFMAQDGYESDGQGSAQTWLRWQTRITRGAAAGAVGWARRLQAHPVIAAALADGGLSASWARQVCDWTDRLPAGRRDEGDEILVTAAAGGAELADLGVLAEEIYQRCAPPDQDGDGGFGNRYLALEATLDGAGRLRGDLTPGATTALSAVLEALGKRAGPEDLRTTGQRRHDALAEACRRLIAAGMVPGRAGQPTRIQVQMTLDQLQNVPGAAGAERARGGGPGAYPSRGPGRLTGPEAGAAACDATIIPVVTGHPDPQALDRLAGAVLNVAGSKGPRRPLSPATRRRLRRALLGLAADALSGPGGMAARLRAGLDYRPLASPSLPLDVGTATETIPGHLRRAVMLRHPQCGFPGCSTPASLCEIHHIIPRSRGGPAALWNLIPLCSFHHLVVIHAWGWQIRLNPDATTTATSPDGRTYHSHDPPARAA